MPRPKRGPYLKPDKQTGIYYIHHHENGESGKLSTRTRNPVEAKKALALYIMGEERIKHEPGWLVREAWGAYWDEHGSKAADSERINNAWRRLEPHFGDMLIHQITVEDVERYTKRRLAQVKSSTVRRELSALTASFNYLVTTKRLKSHELPYVPLPPDSEPRDRWLSAEEIELLHKTAEARELRRHGNSKKPLRLSRVQRFLHIALATGARRRVIERLEWRRVDFARGLIDFDYGGRQTNKKRPVVPISDALRPVLERAYAERIGPYVLDHPGSIRKAFDRCVEEAGLPEVHRHTLRHTWATHASMNGVPLTDIARVLGNSLAMVIRVYAKYQPEYLRAAVNFAPKRFGVQEKAA